MVDSIMVNPEDEEQFEDGQEDPDARQEDSGSATSPNGSSGNGGDQLLKRKKGPPQDGRRHLSCENCRIRKMRCSRTSPCLSCKMRGDECVWIGAAPNGAANEDEVEATQMEVNRLKRLVDLLLTRLEQQDSELERHFPTNPPPPQAPPIGYPTSSSRPLGPPQRQVDPRHYHPQQPRPLGPPPRQHFSHQAPVGSNVGRDGGRWIERGGDGFGKSAGGGSGSGSGERRMERPPHQQQVESSIAPSSHASRDEGRW